MVRVLLNPALSPDNPITAGRWSLDRRQWQPRPDPPAHQREFGDPR